jgi:hypothetical protein
MCHLGEEQQDLQGRSSKKQSHTVDVNSNSAHASYRPTKNICLCDDIQLGQSYLDIYCQLLRRMELTLAEFFSLMNLCFTHTLKNWTWEVKGKSRQAKSLFLQCS